MREHLTAVLFFSLLALSWPEVQAQSPKTNFFLPQNPVAAAYVLGRLSNRELIEAPRSEFVYVALLQRSGLDRKYRLEALEGLARVRHSDLLTELLSGLAELDKKGDEAAATLRDLSQILLQSKPAELASKRANLEELAAHAQMALTRQIAFAGVVAADGSIEPAWQKMESNAGPLADLLLALPLLRDPKPLETAYSKVESLLRTADSAEIRRAAINAVVAIPGHEAENFKTLAMLVQSGTERSSAIASLRRIPQKARPNDAIVPLLNSLMEYLEATPAGERTGEEFTSALQLATDLSSHAPEEQRRVLTKTLRGLGPAMIVLRAIYEQMRFDQQLIAVEAGKPVALTLENEDAMPHNLAILSPGALEEIGVAAEKMAAEPDAQGRLYIPASPKVLQATKLIFQGQKTQLVFTAPTELGEYPYVCTFPGHWRRMSGVMAVVADLEAYLAKQAAAEQPKMTEWKLEDLASDLPKVALSRNLENGKKLFTQLACLQCHKLGKEGYAYGPDLTNVLSRYKNDRTSLLQQILEPSKVIEERYRNINFELKNGEPAVGMVLKENGQSVTIQTGPADSLVQTLSKSDIQQRLPQTSSPMPLGLLNALSKEQILDLLAYLESGGEAPAHAHSH